MMSATAIVVGGGVGGLTAAIALRRAGIDAVVYERASDLRHVRVGGALHLWHNGMRGLQQLDLGERVRALGGEGAVLARADFYSWRGRPLFGWSASEVERRTGAPTVGVGRADLLSVLAGAVDTMRLGASCTGFSQDESGVAVRLADGHEARADVLIGADGLRSTIRGELVGDGEPSYAGYASWQAFVEFPAAQAPIGALRVFYGRGARFLFYRVSAERLYWEGIAVTPAGGEAPAEGSKRALLERFAGWAEPVEAIVGATDDPAIGRMEIHTRKPSKRWGTGRVTLLGDAAHPMTNAVGQGANQAIEDAIVLSRCLAGARDGHEAALRAYEAQRIPRTTEMVRLSANLTRLARWRRPWACAVRDGLLRSASPIITRQQAKALAHEY